MLSTCGNCNRTSTEIDLTKGCMFYNTTMSTWTCGPDEATLQSLIDSYVRDYTTIHKRLTVTKAELRRAFQEVAEKAVEEYKETL